MLGDLEKPKANSPQTVARATIAAQVYSSFEEMRQERDRQQDLFRDRTLVQYINDNVKRFIQFKRRPDWKKLWQSNLASSTPNEKLIGILSKLASKGMEVKVVSQREISTIEIMKERIANSFLKAAAIKNDDDFQIILEMLEAAEKGTVIGFEDWYHGKRKIREVLDQDPETGELRFEEITIKEWNDVRSSLVNLEDFYPRSINVRPGKIQDMDSCCLRTIMSKPEFDAEFGKYPDADKVQTISSWVNESTPFWRQSQDVGIEQVEVIRYFDKKSDEYIILANEIWINPKGDSIVSPLPWNHKKLPFWAAVFEPLDANYFYGRSFIDKLISFCDAKDALFDRILDQMTIAVSKPVITDGNAASAMTKGFLQPNNVITTDWSGGRPKFDVVPIADPPVVALELYKVLQQNLEQSSISSEVLGSSTGQRKTATQSSIEREGALELISLFLKLMEQGIKEKNKLRFANMLQFYSLPSNNKKKELRFKQVILRNEKLSNGNVGTLQISVKPKISQKRVEELDRSVLGKTEFIEITTSLLRDFDSEIEIIPQSSLKMTEAQRQILELNYQRVMHELYIDKFNRDAGFEELNLRFGKDPLKMKNQQIQQTQQFQQGEMGKVEEIPEINRSAEIKMPQLEQMTTV